MATDNEVIDMAERAQNRLRALVPSLEARKPVQDCMDALVDIILDEREEAAGKPQTTRLSGAERELQMQRAKMTALAEDVYLLQRDLMAVALHPTKRHDLHKCVTLVGAIHAKLLS